MNLQNKRYNEIMSKIFEDKPRKSPKINLSKLVSSSKVIKTQHFIPTQETKPFCYYECMSATEIEQFMVGTRRKVEEAGKEKGDEG